MWHDSSCTHTSSSDKTDWLLTVNVYTLTAYHQQDYSELANFKHHSLSVGVQFMLIDATSQIQLQKPAIRDSLHSATHGMFHICYSTWTVFKSLRQFNCLSGISIFTSQLVWDTRLPLVECGRACHAPAIILVRPIHSPTTTVVIHPVSIPSNPSALIVNLMSGLDPWLILKRLTE